MRNLFNWAAARLVAAFAFALPLAALAVDYTGTDYAPWSYSKGCIVWRATSGQLFHASTVADVGVDEEGKIEIGDTYNFGSSGHPWQVFAKNQSQYDAPGKVLVFDEAGYNNNSDAQFAPFDFGGMWVRALQAENTPYCITDSASGGTDRTVYLGASSYSTYFKFDKSFTFDRNSQTKVMGVATVEIADGATFKINARASKGAAVDVGNTLVMKGNGVLDVGSGLSVSGTLDLSATTVPTIDGDVTLIGESTIVLPAGTELPYTVCTGTLSAPAPVLVKIGDAEAENKSLTVSGGAITAVGEPNYVFTDNYPTTVPLGKIYTFVGGETAESAVTVPSTVNVSGTLKTSGFITVPYYAANTNATLDVIDGTTTLNCGSQAIKGVVTVRENATLVNTTTDAITYGTDRTVVNVYGTVSMGNTRWSLKNTAINMYGGTITGDGQGTNGALDFLLEDGYTGELNAYATSTISASIKFRNTLVPVTVEEGATLTLSGVIRTQTSAAGVTKKGVGNLTFTSSPTFPAGIVHENGHLVFSTEDDVNLTTTYTSKPSDTTSLWYARQSNWKGTVVLSVLSAPTALPLDTYGNANSKIVLKGTTGNCYLDGTTTVPAEVVIDTDEDHVVEFNNGNSGQVGTFSKISGAGTLKLTAWGGCSGATYNLNTISNFTGTLAINNGITRGGGGTFTIGIGNIVTTGATTPGSKVLNLTQTAVSGATGTVVYNLADTLLNGEEAAFEVRADGIYVDDPDKITVTVPAIANTTVTVMIGDDTIGTAAGEYSVPNDSVVKVVYEPDAGYAISGTTEYTIDTASATTFDPSESTHVATAVAYIGTTPYGDLATAFASVDDDETLTLVGAEVTLNSDVTVGKSYTLAGEVGGTAVTGTGKIYLTETAELKLDATVTVGNQFWFNSKDAELTFPSDKTPASVRPLSGYAVGTRDNEDGTKTYYMYRFLMLSVGGSNVTFAYAEGATTNGAPVDAGAPVVAQQVDEGDNLVFTVTPVDGYVDLAVTCNGETITPVDGKYTVVVGTVSVVIQATVTAGPTVVQIGDAEYPSIAAAFASAESGDTVKVLCDNTSNVRSVRVKEGATVTLDLNSCTVTGPSGDNPMFWLENDSNFVVTDTSEDRAGKLVSEASKVVWSNNRCTFTLTAGTIESTADVPIYIYFGGVNGSRIVNINGGKLVSSTSSSSNGDFCIMNANGIVNMTAGEIVSSCGGIRGSESSISGGTITVNRGVFYSTENQRVTGGTFNKDVSEYVPSGYEVVNNGDGTYTVRPDMGWVYAAQGYWNYTGSWTGVTPAADDQKVTIEDGATYTATKASAGDLVTLEMTMSFEDINDDEDDLGNAKAAIRLGAGETEGTYVFQLYTYENSAAVWKNATGFAPTVNTDYKIVFELDLSRKTYTAGVVVGTTTNALSVGESTAIAFAYQGEATAVQTIDFVGSGSVTSIEGSYGAAPPIGFVEDQVIGNVTLTSAQAAWLNGQGNYDALAAKIATMTATAFNDAYLLNLDVTASNSGYVFAVTDIAVGEGAVDVTVTLTRTGALTEKENAKPIVGTLKLKGTATLGTAFTVLATEAVEFDENADFGEGATETTVTVDTSETDAKFYLPVIE